MATNQTEHFQLNQWVPEDAVLREDFNTDNQKLDQALNTLQTGLKGKAAQTALDGVRYQMAAKADQSAVDALRNGEVRVWLCRRELENDTCISHGLMDLSLPLCFYDEGDEIAADSLRFAVLATPGHTPGSVCLRCGGLLFTGDTLIAGSCGRVDFPGGSAADMLASLRRLAALDGSLTVLSGHAAPTTLAHERQTNPFMLEALR